MLHGCDISENQGQVDFDALLPNVDFVIVRASYGPGRVDAYGEEYREKVRAGGRLLAHYHYALPNESAAPEQARVFLDSIGDLRPGEPLIVDIEEDANDLAWWAEMFCRILLDVTGKPPLLYTNRDYLQRHGFGNVAALDCGLWLADWTGSVETPANTSPFAFAAFKQYTDAAPLPGFAAPVDGDVFYGDENAFRLYGKDPESEQPQEETAVEST